MIAIKIADQTNPKRDVVQVIAVDVAAVYLAAPPIAHLDLAVAGRCSVTDDEMISEPVLHAANMSMVIIESGGVALSSAAVVNDNVLPASVCDRCAIDLVAHGTSEITIPNPGAAPATAAAEKSRPKPARFFVAIFFDG